MGLNFSDLKTFFNNRYYLLELEAEEPSLFREGDLITVNSGAYCTVATSPENGGQFKECRACFKTKQYESDYNAHSADCICRIKEITGNILTVEMLYNPARILHNELFADGMSIAVVDEALKGVSASEFDNEFQQNFKFKIGEHSYFLVGRFLESRKDDTFILVDPLKKQYLSVVTKNLSDLQLESDDENDTKKMLVIERKQKNLCNVSSFQFSLFRGGIQLVDKTEKAQLKAGTLAWLNNGGGKYVKIWKQYAEQEMLLIDESFREAGVLEFSAVRINDRDELVFKIENSAAIPTFCNVVENAFGGQVEIVMSSGFVFGGQLEVRANNRNEITVSSEKQTAGRGHILPNKYGSQVVFERRQRASDAILNSYAVNPCLAMILDGEKRSSAEQKLPERIELDEAIIKDIFPYGANKSQRDAIKMAINTPDIAIIQGPPGTGKTRVIRAIFRHLQKYDMAKNDEVKHLITAYQNDAAFNAVENMTDGFGLPIFLYARADVAAGNLRQLKAWCNEREQAVSSKFNLQDKRERKERIGRLKFISNAFGEPCTFQQAIDKLNCFLLEVGECLKEKSLQDSYDDAMHTYMRKIQALIRKFEQRIRRGEEYVIKGYIAKLPTSSVQIADGTDFVKNILIYISSDSGYADLFKDELAALKEIMQKSILQKEDYARLKDIKVQMALKLKQKDKLTIAERAETALQMRKIIELLNDKRLETKDEILLDYIDDMLPTEELSQAIQKYQTINAATHQRTLGQELFSGKELPKFKSILVDEAARSCPCDLMIPLACSEEKIILVGDENQLPQFLNATTVEKLAGELDENELKDLKRELAGEAGERKSFFSVSMFEYLKENVASRFKSKDGQVRVIKLLQQYRMPPTLGEFVSEQFYNGDVENGTDFLEGRKVPERFIQKYPLIGGLNMVWVDVPRHGNTEQPPGGPSYFRNGEINAIFTILEKIGGKFLSENERLKKEDREKIGIITGYSAQRGRIEERLLETKWDRLREYIEVGTIDSFQGKEFDIVFLSCVRTEKYGFLNIKEQDKDDFKLSRAGSQRTCVAFSRARKCMIVVWASEMVSGKSEKKAKECVPAFVEFYKECKEEKDGVCKVLKWSDLGNGHAD